MLSGFELYPRWVPLTIVISVSRDCMKTTYTIKEELFTFFDRFVANSSGESGL